MRAAHGKRKLSSEELKAYFVNPDQRRQPYVGDKPKRGNVQANITSAVAAVVERSVREGVERALRADNHAQPSTSGMQMTVRNVVSTSSTGSTTVENSVTTNLGSRISEDAMRGAIAAAMQYFPAMQQEIPRPIFVVPSVLGSGLVRRLEPIGENNVRITLPNNVLQPIEHMATTEEVEEKVDDTRIEDEANDAELVGEKDDANNAEFAAKGDNVGGKDVEEKTIEPISSPTQTEIDVDELEQLLQIEAEAEAANKDNAEGNNTPDIEKSAENIIPIVAPSSVSEEQHEETMKDDSQADSQFPAGLPASTPRISIHELDNFRNSGSEENQLLLNMDIEGTEIVQYMQLK